MLRGGAKILAQPRVILDQLRILENQVLANQALERRRLLIELPARASRLRRLHHGLLSLRSEPVEADDELDERVQQRETDQQEPEQDELEE